LIARGCQGGLQEKKALRCAETRCGAVAICGNPQMRGVRLFICVFVADALSGAGKKGASPVYAGLGLPRSSPSDGPEAA
jgi:hypothetical protein